MLEITKMLTISTGHVTQQTLNMLKREGEENNFCLCVYPKDKFGYFIYLTPISRNNTPGENSCRMSAFLDQSKNIPEDLKNVLQFCCDAECGILCLDNDGEQIPYLPWYED